MTSGSVTDSYEHSNTPSGSIKCDYKLFKKDPETWSHLCFWLKKIKIYKYIFKSVLCGCETWYISLYRKNIYEGCLWTQRLRTIFRFKREKEKNIIICIFHQINGYEKSGTCTTHGGNEKRTQSFGRKTSKQKKPLGR